MVMMMVTKMKRVKRVKVEMLASSFRRLLNLAVKVLGRWTKFGGGGSKFEVDMADLFADERGTELKVQSLSGAARAFILRCSC